MACSQDLSTNDASQCVLVWGFQGDTVADTASPSIITTTLKGVDKQSKHPLRGGSVNSIEYTHRSPTGTNAMASRLHSSPSGKRFPRYATATASARRAGSGGVRWSLCH